MEEIPFDPFPLISGAHRQTVLGSFINNPKPLESKTEKIVLSDRAALTCEVNTPKDWKKNDLSVVLVHGLCGSHNSSCLVRCSRTFYNNGIQTFRLNLRNSGSARGLSKKLYHGGQTEDLLEVLKFLKEKYPDSPFALLGFSLGGNLVLKLSGELGEGATKYYKQAIALNSPVDLHLNEMLFDSYRNRFYRRYFVRLMRQNVLYLQDKFSDIPKIEIPLDATMKYYDEVYTSPTHGFRNPEHYYKVASSIYYLNEIKIPCRILFAKDDPIICSKPIWYKNFPKNVEVFYTEKGGHLGYIANPKTEKQLYWLDNTLLNWLKDF